MNIYDTLKSNKLYYASLICVFSFLFFLIFFKLGSSELGHYREEFNEGSLAKNTNWTIVKNDLLKSPMHYSYNNYHEYRYSTIVQTILESGNWFRLQIKNFNSPMDYYHKGPVYFWLSALASKVIGFSILSVRLFPALFGFASAFLVYFLSKSIFSNRIIALISVFILATTFQFIHIDGVRAVSIDAVFIFFILLAVYLLINQGESSRLFYLSVASIALAGLTRAVTMMIPLIIFSVIIDFIISYKKNNKIYFIKKWLIGLVVIFSIFSPWALAQYYQGGDNYIEDIKKFQIQTEFSNKIFIAIEGLYEKFQYNLFLNERPSDLMFYPMTVFKGFFPWSIFSFIAILYAIKVGWDKKDKKILALLAVIFSILIFVYIKEQKWARYMIDLYPFLTIFVAKVLYDFYNIDKNLFLNIGIISSFLFFYKFIIPYNFNALFLIILIVIFSLILFVCFLRYHKSKFRKIAVLFIGLHFSIIAIINVLQPFFL